MGLTLERILGYLMKKHLAFKQYKPSRDGSISVAHSIIGMRVSQSRVAFIIMFFNRRYIYSMNIAQKIQDGGLFRAPIINIIRHAASKTLSRDVG